MLKYDKTEIEKSSVNKIQFSNPNNEIRHQNVFPFVSLRDTWKGCLGVRMNESGCCLWEENKMIMTKIDIHVNNVWLGKILLMMMMVIIVAMKTHE